MKTFKPLAILPALLLAVSMTWTDAGAEGFVPPPGAEMRLPDEDRSGADDDAVILAQADCAAAAAQAAAQTGGQVLSVSAQQQGGRTVCVVTVLVPGQGGERPRRTTITIPG